MFSTHLQRELETKWCDHWDNRVVQYHVRVGEVASMDGQTIVGDFGEASLCSAGIGVCKTDDATVTWNATKFSISYCPYELRGNFKVNEQTNV